jgi:hypothetical protein
MGARDAVRLAFLQRSLNFDKKRTEVGLQSALQNEMERMGVALQALELFASPARAAFLRMSSTPCCPLPSCGKLLRNPSNLSSYPTQVPVSASKLTAAGGDCFAALDAKLNQPEEQEGTRICPHCHRRARFRERPHTSLADDGAPLFIILPKIISNYLPNYLH